MNITKFSQEYHEKMFPGYVSKFRETDPEFIERFDNFALEKFSYGYHLLKKMWHSRQSNPAMPVGFPHQVSWNGMRRYSSTQ